MGIPTRPHVERVRYHVALWLASATGPHSARIYSSKASSMDKLSGSHAIPSCTSGNNMDPPICALPSCELLVLPEAV